MSPPPFSSANPDAKGGLVDLGPEVEDFKPPVKLEDIIDYRDLWGEYPRLFILRTVATLVLIYIMAANFQYHDPADSYVTEYGQKLDSNFGGDVNYYLMLGVGLGLLFYTLSLLQGRYKRIAKLGIPLATLLWVFMPVIQGGTEQEFIDRYSTFLGFLFSMFLGGPAMFGTYGIWKRKGIHIGISLIILIAIGFLYTGELEQNTTTGITYGLLFVLYIEIAFASIKYDAYVLQFRPAEQSRSVITESQRKEITRRLDGLLFKFLFLLGLVLFVTLTLAGTMLNLHDLIAEKYDGPISNSVELSSIYGIVFLALLTFALLGIVRMFLSVERE